MASVEGIDGSQRVNTSEPDGTSLPRDASPQPASNVAEPNRGRQPSVSSSSADYTSNSYRANTIIPVHRKPYIPDLSDSSSDSDFDSFFDDSLPGPQPTHVLSIGDYINVGHQNWLALRQEWKKRPVDWTPKRRLNMDSQTICDRITTSGVLSERSDEGVPLPEVVRVMVQVWEREGVN